MWTEERRKHTKATSFNDPTTLFDFDYVAVELVEAAVVVVASSSLIVLFRDGGSGDSSDADDDN